MAIVNLILMIIFGVAALTLAILMAIFVLPEKKRNRLSGFFCMLHDLFNFKLGLAEVIIKVCTIAGCLFTATFGFIYTFTGFVEVPNGWSSQVVWQGYIGLIMMIAGPVYIYVLGTLLIKFLHMADNMVELNKKTARTAKAEPAPAPAPKAEPKKPAAPQPETVYRVEPVAPQPETVYRAEPVQEPVQNRFCGRCGARLDENGKCPVCDRTLSSL